MTNGVTDSAILKSISKPNGGIDKVQVLGALIFFSIVLISCFVITLGLYWLEIDDNPPASVENIIMYSAVSGGAVDAISVHPGGQIAFSVNFCKFTTSAAVIRRTWLNDLVYHSAEGEGHAPIPEERPALLPLGCGTQLVVLDVPSTLPPEEYLLSTTVTYQVNPVKERFIAFAVGPIIVKEP